jgi:hypothetical protein
MAPKKPLESHGVVHPAPQGRQVRAAVAEIIAPKGSMVRPDFIKPKQEKEAEIDEKKDPVAKMARDLANAKAWKDQAEEELSNANKEVDRLEKELADEMLARKVDLFRVPGLGTFSQGLKNYPSVNDQNSFFAWLKKTKNDGLIKPTVHPQTLKGFINEWLSAGNKLPPGVNNFPKPSIRFTKAKAK